MGGRGPTGSVGGGGRKAGKQRDLGSNPLRFSFLFTSCGLWTVL